MIWLVVTRLMYKKGAQNDIVLCPFALTLTLYDLLSHIASLFFACFYIFLDVISNSHH